MSARLRRERGSALLVAVLVVALLGTLGLAALSTVTSDEQVAGYSNRKRVAFGWPVCAWLACRSAIRANPRPAKPMAKLRIMYDPCGRDASARRRLPPM